MTRPTDDQLTEATRILALQATANAGYVRPALAALNDASGALKAASSGPRGKGSHSDPTPGALGLNGDHDNGRIRSAVDPASRDRDEIDRIILRMLGDSARLHHLLATWAPDPEQAATIWCDNHKRHGIEVPRHGNHMHCQFCDSFARQHTDPDTGKKLYPNRWLLDVHARRRVNSADLAKAARDIVSDNRETRRLKKQSKKNGADA